jgi:hypothetical protein
MRNDDVELRYYNTYYYANFIYNLLSDRWDYLRTLHDLFENDGEFAFIEPFAKYSALHIFTEFAVGLLFYEDLDSEYTADSIKKGDPRLTVNHAFDFYNLDHMSFKEWLLYNKHGEEDIVEDQLYDYYQDLCLEQAYEDLMKRIADEVFFIMFLNRNAMLLLNDLIADHVSEVKLENLEESERVRFEKNGVLKRVSIPEWVRKAVMYRDRGACAICRQDISGLVSISNERHFDHIVPLALGGINDITNIQLLCDECNLKKGKRNTDTSVVYERWYV